MRTFYIDSSALVAIIFDEPNAKALKPFLGETFVTSQISRVEVMRSVLRNAPHRQEIAQRLLEMVTIIPVKKSILVQAENFPERMKVRGMDSIHLASAASLDFLRIAGVITYDKEMAKGAEQLGFEVFAPTIKKGS